MILSSSPFKSNLEDTRGKNEICNTVTTKGKTMKRNILDKEIQPKIKKPKLIKTIKENDSDSEVSQSLYYADLHVPFTESWI